MAALDSCVRAVGQPTEVRQAASVVEVQVCHHDVMDIGRADAETDQLAEGSPLGIIGDPERNAEQAHNRRRLRVVM